MYCAVRDAFQLEAEIRIIFKGIDLFDDFCCVEFGEHIARERGTTVPIPDKTMRGVSTHFISRLEVF